MLDLDTHVLLHAVAGRLTAAETRLLSSHPWSIAAIVLWEIAKLAGRGRIAMDLDDPDVVDVLRRIGSDPADQLIAATSLVHGVPLA